MCFDESSTDGAECSRKVASGRRVAGAIRSLVNVRDLQLECARVLHETLLVLLWEEKERSRIRAVHIDKVRGLICIRRMDRVPNALIRELCEVTKGVEERIDEGVLRWLTHVEGMENDTIAKRVYVRECTSSHSVDKGIFV